MSLFIDLELRIGCSSQRVFEEEFLREGTEVLKHVIPKMVQIWKQLGFPPTKIQERFTTTVSHNKVNLDIVLFQQRVLTSDGLFLGTLGFHARRRTKQ